jgi:acetyl-CoA carboxylase beta subunit
MPFVLISKSGGARMMEAAFFFNANGKKLPLS